MAVTLAHRDCNFSANPLGACMPNKEACVMYESLDVVCGSKSAQNGHSEKTGTQISKY